MANLAESATYDAGVYQLEVTDAVVGGAGGVANAAAKNLANRTTYLKAQVDAMQAGNATKIGVRDGLYNAAVVGGAADALTASFTPAVTALVNGATLHVRGISANATATPTLAVNGLAAKTIVKGNNLPLVAGDIAGAGHWLELQYDILLDAFVLQNPAFGISGLSVADFAADQLLGINGYQVWPGPNNQKIIDQWGEGISSGTGSANAVVTFHFAFPNGVCWVDFIPKSAANSYQGQVSGAPTLTGATGKIGTDSSGASGISFIWKARGY